MSNNLNITQLAASQNNKETTINNKDGELDAAISENEDILVDNTNARTITATEWTRNVFFEVADDSPAPTANFILDVPNTKRGMFAVTNGTQFVAQVGISGQSLTRVEVSPGATRILVSDGINVTQAASESSSPVAGSGTEAVLVGGFIPPSFVGTQVYRSTNGSVMDHDGQVIYDTVVYDTAGAWNAGSPTRLTVPAGVTKVRLTGSVWFNNAASASILFASIRKNDALDQHSAILNFEGAATGDPATSLGTGVLEVVAGDWFAITISTNDPSYNYKAPSVNFFMEVVETTDVFNQTAQVVTVNGIWNGAVAVNAADLTAQDFESGLAVTWDTDQLDRNSFHDTSTNTNRMTVPSGVNIIQVGANIRLNNLIAGLDYDIRIRKNGLDFPAGGHASGTTVDTTVEASLTSPPVSVVPGDWFEVFIDIETGDTSVDVDALASAFWISVIERAGATDVLPAFIAVQPEFNGVLVKTNLAQSITAATLNAIEFDSAVYDDTFNPDDTGQNQRMWLGANFDFVDADVSVANDTISEAGHGLTTGEGPFQFTTTGTLPAGLALVTNYWAIKDSDTLFRVALSRADAIAGTDVDITAAAGGGTHTMFRETYLVVPAGVNRVKFTGHAALSGSTGDVIMELHKNGAIVDGGFQVDHPTTTDPDQIEATSAVLVVAEGDRFELMVNPASGTVTLDNAVLDTYLAMEIVESNKALSYPGIAATPPWSGAMVRLGASLTLINANEGGGGYIVPWNTEDEDTGEFHDNVTDNSRITIPVGSGITRVNLTASILLSLVAANEFTELRIYKNGGLFQGSPAMRDSDNNNSDRRWSVSTADIPVNEGDYFEVYVATETDTSITVAASSLTWFSMTVVETNENVSPSKDIETVLLAHGAALAINDIVYQNKAVRRFSFFDDFAGSVGDAGTAPSGADQIFDVKVDGSTIGTITITDGTNTFTFVTTGGGQENVEIGEILTIETQGTVDTTTRDIQISMWAFLS